LTRNLSTVDKEGVVEAICIFEEILGV